MSLVVQVMKYLLNNRRGIPDRVNISDESLVHREEFSESRLILFGFNVEERERSCKTFFREVWYRLNNERIKI